MESEGHEDIEDKAYRVEHLGGKGKENFGGLQKRGQRI